MKQHNGVDIEQQSRLLTASVHQARQPLYVLQNTLFAANLLAQRQESSPDLKLIQQALTEMRAAVDRLTTTISVIAGIAKPETRKPVETVLADLVKEAFQMSSFCLRNEYGMVNYELPQIPSGSTSSKVLLDYPTVLLALIRWILDAASHREFHGNAGQDESLTLSASADEGDVTIQISNSQHSQKVHLGQIVAAATSSIEQTGLKR